MSNNLTTRYSSEFASSIVCVLFFSQELELKLADASEASAVAAAVKTQLAQVAELTKENRRLKDENEYNRRTQDDALVLREQLIGLEQKLERELAINRELSSNQAQYEVRPLYMISADRRWCVQVSYS